MIGIKVKHFSNSFSSDDFYKTLQSFGKSNTDTSTWRPTLSIARSVFGQGASSKKFLYDFKDGKDTGETVQTFIRSKGLDITEIESAEKRVTTIIEDKKFSDAEKLSLENERKEFRDQMKKLSDSVSNSSDSSNANVSKS